MTTVEGIVLKERSVGEQDKFIDILTKESGV
ncbi:MAG: recombination protein O N-terminal domain-containing protein, partial [Ruminococcus sp.]|nr:recombination protein O N-terminal domain-containing protein [Ruminococcus sp.]